VGALGTLELAGERDEPAVASQTNRRGKDLGSALLDAAGKLAGGLVRPDPSKAGQHDVMPVRLHPDRPGGEPARLPPATLAFAPREPHSRTRSAVVAAGHPVRKARANASRPEE
jgi:hypothetical protein